MKHYLIPLLTLPNLMLGQAPAPDSTRVNRLEEITVVARTAVADAGKTVYMPTMRQKEAAADGVALLALMNIPQLDVNPLSATVKTASGQPASIFINSHPASPQDLAGLNPADVRKVEYLDFPSDPRFLGAKHAVNFFTRQYMYGGYTKLSAKERFLISSGEAALYSKFAHRSMEYDVMLSGDYDYNRHIGTSGTETYRLPSATVVRESAAEAGKHRERSLFCGVRASWNKGPGFSFRNIISYRRKHTPVSETYGSVTFTDLYPPQGFSAGSQATSNAISWDSELYIALGKGWSLNGSTQLEALENDTHDSYTTETQNIENIADEHALYLRGDFRANKSLSDNITLFAALSAAGNGSSIEYAGTSNTTNHFRQNFAACYAGVAASYRKASGSIDAGYAFESTGINGRKTDDGYPFTHINVQYAPSDKHSASIWLQYATMSPGAAMKNPNIIRQSELMYICGNPDLRNSRTVTANISYTYLPGNRWQMSAYATFFKIIDRQIEVYTPEAPGGTMLKKYRNDGDYNHGQLGARLSAKFFGGKLSLSAAPRLLLYNTTGSNSIARYPFTFSASADCHAGDFIFSAYWESPACYVDGETSYLRKMPSEYSVSAGWAAKGWNISIVCANWFNSSWRISTDTLATRWYDSALTRLGSMYHRRIALGITYTFNYGRKVSRADELSGESHISSSILR